MQTVMQAARWAMDGQGELAECIGARAATLPRVRPQADAELEATFVRAALAWAKWRERRKWAGR